MKSEVTIKRRSARLSAKYSRQSMERIENKMGIGQSKNDEKGAIDTSSDKPSLSNTISREQLQLSNESSNSRVVDINVSQSSTQENVEQDSLADVPSTRAILHNNGSGLQDIQCQPPSQDFSNEEFDENNRGGKEEEQRADDCANFEVIESVTTTGVNGRAWWQTSQRRVSQRLMAKNGRDRTSHVLTYHSVRKVTNTKPVIDGSIRRIKNGVSAQQPQVSNTSVHQTSETCCIPMIEDGQMMEYVVHKTSQQVIEESLDNDSSQFITRPQDFLDQSPSQPFSVDENENDDLLVANEEQGDKDHAEHMDIESSTTSQRRSRKKSVPRKRRDHVTKEIATLQSMRKLLIPKRSFQRVVRDILLNLKNDYRMQSVALECLRESSEAYLVQLFEDAKEACYHRNQATLKVKDMHLVHTLRGDADPGRK